MSAMKTVTFRVPTFVYMAFGDWANHLPAVWRKRIYKSVKWLASLTTLALVIIPALPVILPAFGLSPDVFTLSDVERDSAIGTAVLAFVSHLADTNTHPEDEVQGSDTEPEPDPATMPSMGLPMAAEPETEEEPPAPAVGRTGKPIVKVQVKAAEDDPMPTEVTIAPRNVASL
jgi:hypothetical protein